MLRYSPIRSTPRVAMPSRRRMGLLAPSAAMTYRDCDLDALAGLAVDDDRANAVVRLLQVAQLRVEADVRGGVAASMLEQDRLEDVLRERRRELSGSEPAPHCDSGSRAIGARALVR